MNHEASEEAEDRIAARAEDLDAALATGEEPPAVEPDSLAPADLVMLRATQESLLFLEQVWPRNVPRAAEGAGTRSEADADASDGDRPPPDFGRFRVVRELGRGGFGVVFLAIDPELNRPVALKLPRAEALLDDRGRERFVGEARAVAGLDHPNIVPLYEAGEVHRICYMASAYCDGPNLAGWLREHGGPIDPRTAARIVADLADAVQHAHDRGILHRDLKPSNILLHRRPAESDAMRADRPTGDDDLNALTPRIVDFGLARLMDRSAGEVTASFAAVGTAPYMAPEQAEGRKVGPAVDVYGLGALLYAMLCGRPPHRGRSDLDTLRRVVADEIIPPRRLRRDVPRDLEAVCLKCLEKHPARRYTDAGAVRDDLRRFLAGAPTQTRAAGLWRRLRREVRRHPSAAVALVLVAAVALGVNGFKARLDQARGIARQRGDEARRRDLAARRNRYIADVRHAAQLIRNGQADLATPLLERNRPGPGEMDLRGFVWFHLWRRSHTERLSLEGHRGDVYHAEFSPDGRAVASSGLDGTVRLWDPATGVLIRSIQAHESEVNWVAFSPDGKSLATTSDDGRVRLFDTVTGARRLDLPAHRGIAVIVRFTPDGRRLVTCGRDDGDVKIWDASSGRPLGAFHTAERRIEGMALSPNGDIVALASEAPTSSLWRISTGDRVVGLGPHDGVVYGIEFSRDGTRVATGSGDRVVRLWDARTGRLLRRFSGHTKRVQSVTWTPDGQTVISAGDDWAVRVWDASNGESRGVHLGHESRVWGVSTSPDGRTIASASHDGTAKLWDIHPSEVPTRLVARGVITALAFSADGHVLIAAGTGGQVWTWDAEAGILRESRRLGHAAGPAEVVLNRDGTLAAVYSQGGVIEVHDLVRGQSLKTIGPIPGGVRAMEFGPEGRRLIVAAGEPAVMIWDLAGARLEAILRREVGRTLSARDGDVLCCGGGDGGPIAWNPADGRTKTLSWLSWWQERPVCLSPDGTLLAMGDDTPVLLCARDSPVPQESLMAHLEKVLALDFSPRGETLASGDSSGVIKLWDVAAREELMTLEPHAGPVRALRFSTDGRTLASCAERSDGTSEVFLWHAAGDDARSVAPGQDRTMNRAH